MRCSVLLRFLLSGLGQVLSRVELVSLRSLGACSRLYRLTVFILDCASWGSRAAGFGGGYFCLIVLVRLASPSDCASGRRVAFDFGSRIHSKSINLRNMASLSFNTQKIYKETSFILPSDVALFVWRLAFDGIDVSEHFVGLMLFVSFTL